MQTLMQQIWPIFAGKEIVPTNRKQGIDESFESLGHKFGDAENDTCFWYLRIILRVNRS